MQNFEQGNNLIHGIQRVIYYINNQKPTKKHLNFDQIKYFAQI